MDTATLLVAVAIAGVNFGWQPADDGSTGYDYTVQIEPELVEVLQRGEAVPIESTIPPEATPLRKVRIVVGRDELPREPLCHTANFAGQGWTPDRYSTPPAGNTNSERYAAAPGAGGVSPPPSVIDRTQTAVTESASAISDGVQAGVRATNDQISQAGSQFIDQSKSAAQDFGQQLQQWTNDAGRQMQAAGNSVQSATQQTIDATGNQLRQAGNAVGLPTTGPTNASPGSVSAPPWPQSAPPPASWPADSPAARTTFADTTTAPGMAITQTPGGWTSIGSSVAAPPLLNPPMSPAANSNPGVRIASGNTGPTFPTTQAQANSEPMHSLLVDPSRQPVTAGTATNAGSNSWPSNAPTAPATIGRADSSAGNNANDNFGMVPVRPVAPAAQNTQQAANRWSDPWAESDPWQQTPQGSPPQTPPIHVGLPPNMVSQPTNQNVPGFANSPPNNGPQSNTVAMPTSPPLIGQNPNAIGTNPHNVAGTSPISTPPHLMSTTTNHTTTANVTDQPPWLPLLLVSLSLVGSLSANLFLGWSYMDARQKYRSLVRKTADTFRRAASAAAA